MKKYVTEYKVLHGNLESFTIACNELSKRGWITADNMKVIERKKSEDLTELEFVQQWQHVFEVDEQ